MGGVLGEGRAVSGRRHRARADFFHCDSATERDRLAAHRAHARTYGNRHPYSVAPDAWLQHAVLAWHGPCGDIHAARRGAPTVSSGHPLPGPGARRVSEARVAMERGKRRNDSAANEADWRNVRLVA